MRRMHGQQVRIPAPKSRPNPPPPPPASPPAAPEVVTEYARRMTGPGFHLYETSPLLESIWPLADVIESALSEGGEIVRRRVIVVEDWANVTGL